MSHRAALTKNHSYHLDKLVGAGLGRRAMRRVAAAGAVVSSGDLVTLDTLSHEGVLEGDGEVALTAMEGSLRPTCGTPW